MTDQSAGEASANDAGVSTEPVAPEGDPREELERRVAAAQAKVEKQRAHLAGAEEALAEAVAALEGGN